MGDATARNVDGSSDMNRVIGSDVQIEEFETLRKPVKKA